MNLYSASSRLLLRSAPDSSTAYLLVAYSRLWRAHAELKSRKTSAMTGI